MGKTPDKCWNCQLCTPVGNIIGWPKSLSQFLYAVTLSNINRFTKLLHCQNQSKICNNTITKRCDGIFSDGIIANFLLILTVKQYRKLVNI